MAAAPGPPLRISAGELAQTRASCRKKVFQQVEAIFDGLIEQAKQGHYNQAKLLFDFCGLVAADKGAMDEEERRASMAEFRTMLHRIVAPPPPPLLPGQVQSEDEPAGSG